MDNYTIRKRFLVWEEVEVFAENEEDAIKTADRSWPQLSPQVVGALEFTGEYEIVLPEE